MKPARNITLIYLFDSKDYIFPLSPPIRYPIPMTVRERAALGKLAAEAMLGLDAGTRDRALEAIAAALEAGAAEIAEANDADLEEAGRNGLPGPLLKRLAFDERKRAEAIEGVRALRRLPDPVGRVLSARLLDEGLVLRQVTCPIGLISMIFESRPDALVQMASLCAKSGNAVLLKGGSEAARTNRVLSRLIAEAGEGAGLPKGWLGALETRQEIAELIELDDLVDLVVPRGSKEFVASIQRSSRIPVLGHSDGVCHVYLHEDADPAMAAAVAVDSKAQSPATCNAAEVLLVHSAFAERGLAGVAAALRAAKVRLHPCARSAAVLERAGIAPGAGEAEGAGEGRWAVKDGDWSVEYLDYDIAIKVVDSLDEAIAHINEFGSGHTDSIVSSSREAAARFMDRVDSSSVYHNASTRFADGYAYGLGAEIGISTGKLHARGPVGLEGLCTYKWKLEGSGQVRADYASGARRYLHRDLGAGPSGGRP
jgi:glutamate-5-semialdehyde dehydrogenase